MISFNEAPFTGREFQYMEHALRNKRISGDGEYTKKCSAWLEETAGVSKVLLTTSGTHALEMAALLCHIRPGDEVIMPAYTFVSTANAFALRGAKIIFVDIRPDTMNIDEKLIENAITERTKAIVPVHYAGVSCEMDAIMDIAKRHHLKVVEDAAQAVMSTYKGRMLGSIGDYGCYSFHETKNYSMGEGGALLLDGEEDIRKAEIIREKGTNRSQFFRGMVDKYSWVDMGSSYLPSDLNAAYLWGNLEEADRIQNQRMASWDMYYERLLGLAENGKISLPVVPQDCQHNAHMFYLKARDMEERTRLLEWLKRREILAVFHYVPLHTSLAGKRYGCFCGEDVYTTAESERLLRLPMYYGLREEDIDQVCQAVEKFYA
jgi:TDP-4-keto-6-deoxy-D-glucose transaminase